MEPIKPYTEAELYQDCDPDQFEFETTAELEPDPRPPGQQRALDAIEFGVDIDRSGYNLFVISDSGFGQHALVRQILGAHARDDGLRSDWCYVNNFDLPQQPVVLRLPAGLGQQLRKDMEQLVEDLLTSLPSSFESEEYGNRRQEIEQEFQDRQEQAFGELDAEARSKGIVIMRTPTGYTLGPAVDGRPLDQAEFEKLPDAEKQRIEQLVAELQLKLQDIIRNVPLLQREHHQRVKALNEEITLHAVEQLMAWIEERYREQPDVLAYLATVKKNAIKDAEYFRARAPRTRTMSPAGSASFSSTAST